MLVERRQRLVSLSIIESLYYLELFRRYCIQMWMRLQKFILEVLGAAGATSFFSGVLLTVLGLSTVLAFHWTLPIIAIAVGAWAFFEFKCKEKHSPRFLIFLLKICGAAAASDFALVFIMMFAAAIGLGFSFPPIVMIIVPLAVALLSFVTVFYKQEEKSFFGKIHHFITNVLGTGGAIYWFLGFVALSLGAACAFPPLVFVIVPAIFMAAAALFWYKAPALDDKPIVKRTLLINSNYAADYASLKEPLLQTGTTTELLAMSGKERPEGLTAYQGQNIPQSRKGESVRCFPWR